ncbi:MAG: hypothetical protein H8E98_02635 [Bacteroidetes bacterium]|nr:hypothetical protein [Bacteroidota bacterium]
MKKRQELINIINSFPIGIPFTVKKIVESSDNLIIGSVSSDIILLRRNKKLSFTKNGVIFFYQRNAKLNMKDFSISKKLKSVKTKPKTIITVTHRTCEEVKNLVDGNFTASRISKFLKINTETIQAIIDAGFDLEKYIHTTEEKKNEIKFEDLPIPDMDFNNMTQEQMRGHNLHLTRWLVKKVSIIEKAVLKLEKAWTDE